MPNEPAPIAVPLYERPEVHDRRRFLLAVLCLSLVMVVMAVSGLNTALPRIQEDLGASSTQLQWIVDAYALVFAGLLLTAGAIGDRFGRKGAPLTGLVVFATGSLVSGLGSSTGQVIAGRAVSGVGAALLMPATLSLIIAVFPSEERTRAIAVWVGFAGAGGAIGPVLSGFLLDHLWWGSVFLANLPVVAAVAAMIAVFSPRSRDDDATPLDPRGAAHQYISRSSGRLVQSAACRVQAATISQRAIEAPAIPRAILSSASSSAVRSSREQHRLRSDRHHVHHRRLSCGALLGVGHASRSRRRARLRRCAPRGLRHRLGRLARRGRGDRPGDHARKSSHGAVLMALLTRLDRCHER